MENRLEHLLQSLQKLMTLHRQLLEVVRTEKTAIREADLSKIQEASYSKEGLIESIRGADSARQKVLVDLAVALQKPPELLTLNQLILEVQVKYPRESEGLRSAQNALTILIQRIQEQNSYNRGLIESSLEHVSHMKKNILGESVPRSDVYTQKAQKTSAQSGGARLISKEV